MKFRAVLIPTALLAVTAIGWLAIDRGWFVRASAERSAPGERAAPVEVAPVEHGAIVERRVFSGTLVPRAQFIVSSKVSGRIESLRVDIGDEVQSGAIIAKLDDDEFQQSVAEAQAELEVARARVVAADAGLDAAERAFGRITDLQESNIASGSELDAADAELRSKRAELDVARAEVQRALAGLEAARVRLGYSTVIASWNPLSGSDASNSDPRASDARGDRLSATRLVAARYLDEGATVAANDPIVTVVDLSTVRAVLFVTERDFARLAIDQPATLRTDAYPGIDFEGRVLRLAPVFEESSRQARVEIEVPNPDRRLRPGMFVRIEVSLSSTDEATIVPERALVRRDGSDGLFVLDRERMRVRYVPVRIGITAADRVQVFGESIDGDVVTLGQQLLQEGSRVHLPEPTFADAPANRPANTPGPDGG